jgi:hypothetical protein
MPLHLRGVYRAVCISNALVERVFDPRLISHRFFVGVSMALDTSERLTHCRREVVLLGDAVPKPLGFIAFTPEWLAFRGG